MSKTFVGVDLTTVNSGQSLKYENGDWVAYSVTGLSYSGITTSSDSYTNLVMDLTTGLIATEPIYNVLTDVIEKTIQTPPTGNTLDDAYIVPSGSTGEWSGQTNNVAIWDGSIWEYYIPQSSDVTTVLTGVQAGIYKFSGGTWNLKTQPVATSWIPIGNALTSTGKIGTTTNYDVNFISNNIVRGGLSKSGRFGFGNTSPNTTVDINGSFAIRNSVVTSIGSTGLIRSVSGSIFITGYVTPIFTGLDSGSNGKLIYVGNKSGVDIILKEQYTGVTASYRIITGVGDLIFKNNTIINLQYDTISSKWRIIGKNKIDYNTDVDNLPEIIISKTYSELYLMYTGSTLISGQKYILSDYKTTHNILDGNTTTGVIETGTTEPLILLATSINTFDKQAYSTLFPKDIIYYDITGGDTRDVAFFDNGTPIDNLKGIIYYRKDTVQNVECWYDFRNVKFRRWLVSATPWVASRTYVATNVYEYNSILYKCIKGHTGVLTTPNLDTTNWIKWLDKTQNWSWTSDKTQFNIGNVSTTNLIMSDPIDIYTFGDYYNWVNDVEIGRINLDYIINNYDYSSKLNNIVFNTTNSLYTCFSNVFGDNCFNNTVGSEFYYNTVGNEFDNNTVGMTFQYNTVGNGFNTNTIGMTFQYNTVRDRFQNNTVGMTFQYNTVRDRFQNNTVGDDFNNNTVGNYFQSNIVRNIFKFNMVENYFRKNNVGDSFNGNIVRNRFETNTVGNGFKCNDLKHSVSSINFTAATHVYAYYNCEIFKNSADVLRLKYVDGSDADVIVDITA
jgi:hypothetical protein